jgi:hypothetical protein
VSRGRSSIGAERERRWTAPKRSGAERKQKGATQGASGK